MRCGNTGRLCKIQILFFFLNWNQFEIFCFSRIDVGQSNAAGDFRLKRKVVPETESGNPADLNGGMSLILSETRGARRIGSSKRENVEGNFLLFFLPSNNTPLTETVFLFLETSF